MLKALNHQLEIFTARASESDATLIFCNRSQEGIAKLTGKVVGPHCVRARTLPATFTIGSLSTLSSELDSANTLITEPCYWTPALPFLYTIDLQVEWKDGATAQCQQSIGLRRWEAQGNSLFQERRRVVLRGDCIDRPSLEQLTSAAEAEIAIVTHDLSAKLLTSASELGVPLLVDLRHGEEQVAEKLTRFSWYPAVAGVLLTSEPDGNRRLPNGAKLGAILDLEKTDEPPTWSDMVVVELNKGELPPASLASCTKPVIAIRRYGDQVDIAEVRTKCDQLQAELAPDFDLAGYFV